MVTAAAAGGLGPGITAAGLGFLCFDVLFLQPYHHIIIDDPQDYLSLGVYLLVAVVVSLLVATSERRRAQAERRERETRLGLPGLDGLEVLHRMRTWTKVPVVVLIAIDGERDKVTALDLGAERLRDQAVRRGRADGQDPGRPAPRPPGRSRPAAGRPGRGVAIDLDAKLVTRAGAPVRLTPIEYRLLETLATNAGRLCTHRFLLERVWGAGYGDESQYLRVYMANLRRKLDDPAAPQRLLTEPGMGYRFVVPDPEGRRPRPDACGTLPPRDGM